MKNKGVTVIETHFSHLPRNPALASSRDERVMDAQAKKKALYRAKLKAQKQGKRIDSPLVRYNESDQPVCRVCDIVLKSDSAWSAHQISAKHREVYMHTHPFLFFLSIFLKRLLIIIWVVHILS
ncbi:hypothetical protein L2E82_48280 [Cichorium intybus]|uniref:Uncharacterized protein n=1 Tax=Cichorium intybus TaxID=13427 RepID=A0ACB8YZ32_CICIN|nr:hypothetical protein L2E82_48280 [Cichorium intybus]